MLGSPNASYATSDTDDRCELLIHVCGGFYPFAQFLPLGMLEAAALAGGHVETEC